MRSEMGLNLYFKFKITILIIQIPKIDHILLISFLFYEYKSMIQKTWSWED